MQFHGAVRPCLVCWQHRINRGRGPAVRFPSSRRFRDFITKAAGRRFDSHRAADSATSAYFFLLLSPSSSLLLPLSLSPSFLVFRVGGMVKNQAASHCGWGDMSAACDALNSPAATRSFRCRNLYAFDGKCNFTAPSGRVLCVGNIELTEAAGRRFDSHRAADSATS